MTNLVLMIDLDGTLVRSNTTFDFIKFICPVRFAIFSRLFFPLTILNIIFKRDIYKLVLIMLCIKGRRYSDLVKYSFIFYKLLFSNKNIYNSLILTVLNSKLFKMKILVTASLDFIAKHFTSQGLDLVIASQSYFKNNKFHRYWDLYRKKRLVVEILLKYFDKVVILDDDPDPEFFKFDKKAILIKIPYEQKN